MSKETRYKMALGELEPNVRTAIRYLESLIYEKHRESLSAIPQMKPPDTLSILVSIDSLQKQIDGLRPKIEEAHSFVKKHDEDEKYLKKLAKNTEKMLEEIRQHFVELYKSGYYKEGQRRKFREIGMIKTKDGEKLDEP